MLVPENVLGTHNILEDEPTQVIITGKEPIVHENYMWYDNYRNDIALIELTKPVTLNGKLIFFCTSK